jgi:hypothetical protein
MTPPDILPGSSRMLKRKKGDAKSPNDRRPDGQGRHGHAQQGEESPVNHLPYYRAMLEGRRWDLRRKVERPPPAQSVFETLMEAVHDGPTIPLAQIIHTRGA